ncbi:MAG: transglutaminase-like domain-containing protein [Myxococcota bacterium]
MAELVWPSPESDDLGRYLEDTITIDWQSPTLMETAKGVIEGCETPEARLEALFGFVRDEISHAFDVQPEKATCSASQVLKERQGLCYAKSHLLAGVLRYAGFPTGFCYARLGGEDQRSGFALHGFNAVYWSRTESWLFVDASGRAGMPAATVRFESPWELPFEVDPQAGESFVPDIYRRPPKRIIDLLERAPDFTAVRRNLPDTL